MSGDMCATGSVRFRNNVTAWLKDDDPQTRIRLIILLGFEDFTGS